VGISLKQAGDDMSDVVLYIATSLDGFIARRDGTLDWLTAFDTPQTDYGYAEFYRTVDAQLMGRKTYEQALGFGEWPHPGKPTWVFTRQRLVTERNDVLFTDLDPRQALREIEARGARRVWLVGGALLVAAFLRERLINEFVISVVPVLLGDGIPLFAPGLPERPLKIVELNQYPTGVVQTRYRIRNSP
jgi:dihydrofolate reductase